MPRQSYSDDELAQLLTLAIAWAQAQEADILASGRPLTPAELVVAKAVGVRHADRVRLKIVTAPPVPEQPQLLAAAANFELLGPDTVSVSFGHGIAICQGELNSRVLSHELRHVQQGESAGSIAAFLQVYLKQIIDVGFERSLFEADARRNERDQTP